MVNNLMCPKAPPSASVALVSVLSLFACAFIPAAKADQPKKTRIVGYGSVGYTVMLDRNTPEGTSLSPADSFGAATTKGTMRNLTRFGLNITHNASETTALVLQLAANGADLFHGTDEGQQFRVRANLAGLKMNFDLLELLAGIVPMGYFLISDTLQMGATYVWAQPPRLFYRAGDSTNVVGGRARKSIEWQDSLLTFEFLFGEMLYDRWYDSQSRVDSRSSFMYSLGVEYEAEEHNFRFVVTAVPEMNYKRYDYRTKVLQTGQPPVILKGHGGCRDAKIEALNASYDGYLTENLRILSEYALRTTFFSGCFGTQAFFNEVSYSENTGYLAVAYTMGRWTPRLLALKQHIAADLDDAARLAASAYPAPARPTVMAKFYREAGYRTREKTDTYGAGLNYQWSDYVVVKGELYHHVTPDANIRGYHLPPDANATVMNMTIDYVF